MLLSKAAKGKSWGRGTKKSAQKRFDENFDRNLSIYNRLLNGERHADLRVEFSFGLSQTYRIFHDMKNYLKEKETKLTSKLMGKVIERKTLLRLKKSCNFIDNHDLLISSYHDRWIFAGDFVEFLHSDDTLGEENATFLIDDSDKKWFHKFYSFNKIDQFDDWFEVVT